MRALLVISFLTLGTGCFFEARGGPDGAIASTRDRRVTGHAGVAIGTGLGDETQAGAAMIGLESSPLGYDRDAGAPGIPAITFGARYERAWSPSRPGVRWYGRVMFGGNLCAASDEMDPPTGNEACASPRTRRSTRVFSMGAGLALTRTRRGDAVALMPRLSSAGLGVIFSAASDEALGGGAFLGLELSIFVGDDPLTRIAMGRHDD